MQYIKKCTTHMKCSLFPNVVVHQQSIFQELQADEKDK